MRRLITSLVLFCLLGSAHANSDVIDLSPLSEQECADYNNSISLKNQESGCIASFSPPLDTPSGLITEYEIKLRINGHTHTLYRNSIDSSTATKFSSKNGRIRAWYDAVVTHDSCEEVEDKCCGQDYEGKLFVRVGKKQRSFAISFYRGG
jgi:hypothetical protein